MTNLVRPPGNYYPPIEYCEQICELLDRGYSVDAIGDLMAKENPTTVRRPSDHRRMFRRMAVTISKDRVGWYPYMDTLNMELAYEGNRAAWDELSHYERREVLNRMSENYATGRYHPCWPNLDISEGTAEWCRSVGVETYTIHGTEITARFKREASEEA